MSPFKRDLFVFGLACSLLLLPPNFADIQKEGPPLAGDTRERVWRIHLSSFEAESNGLLEIFAEVACLKEDDRLFQPTLLRGPFSEWLTDWWVHSPAPKLSATRAGDTYAIRFFLKYDPENLPFSYRRFQLGLRDEAGQVVEKLNAYVYFTPYGITELWNPNDFGTLNRRWDRMHQGEAERQKWELSQLSKRGLDLLKAAGPGGQTGLNQAKPRKTESLPGLAYAIPVATGPEDQNPQGKTDFLGTVEGQVMVKINSAEMNIADIAVEVWELNPPGNHLLATGFTDDDGRFSIPFQANGGGSSEMAVYLTLVSYNQSDLIRVRNEFGAIRNESFFTTMPAVFQAGIQSTHDFGKFEADTNLAKPQLLHWANRSRQFVDGEVPGVLPDIATERLHIMPSFIGSNEAFFFPGGYTWDLIFVTQFVIGPNIAVTAAILALVSDRDGLYFGADRETDENKFFHEFGHYLMWHLQGRSWISISEAGFATHCNSYNSPNPKICWTEGFAHGFANIMDTWSQADDGEYGADNWGFYEERTRLSGRRVEDVIRLQHGFLSEWNVGCALYDLWDGPGQPLQNGSPLPNASDTDDLGIDDVELSFADIVLPLQNHAGTGGFHMDEAVFGPLFGNDQEQYLLTDIVAYHGALMDALSPDCQTQRQVTDLLNADSVNNFFPTSFLNGDLLSSDMLAFNNDVTTTTYDANGNPTGVTVNNFSVDVTMLLDENDEYNLSNFESVPNSYTLSDDLLVSGDPVRNSAILYFNGARTFGWQSPANSYAAPWQPGIPPGEALDVDLCGNMTLEVREGGKLVVGEPNAPPATVRLTSGSTLILGGDGNGAVLAQETTYNTFVSMGTLEINEGSRFIVEAGATLIYNRGGNILLNADTSVLEIYGDIIVSEMANFKPTGDGEVIFGLPDLGGAPNVTVNNLSVIQFLELRIRLLPFTYFRPDDHTHTSFLMEHGIAGMGEGSYIHTGVGTLVMDLMDYASTDGGFHQGVWINNINHSITEITMSGGAPGLWGQSTIMPLIVEESDILNCDTGILVGTGGVYFGRGTISNCATAGIEAVDGIVTVEDSVLEWNHLGIHTFGGRGTLSEVIVRNGDIGWRAEDPSSDLSILSSSFSNHAEFGIHVNSFFVEAELNDVLMEFNQVGLRAEGSMDVRIDCSNFIDNIDSAITMADGATLDMSAFAHNTIQGSDVNLTLVDAARPLLDGGHNRWTTTDAGDFNILGTIVHGTCDCTPGQDAMGNPVCDDPWYFSDISGELSFLENSFTTPILSERIEILDAATGQCAYLPLTSPAVQTCPIIP